jgi:hypothetical protein
MCSCDPLLSRLNFTTFLVVDVETLGLKSETRHMSAAHNVLGRLRFQDRNERPPCHLLKRQGKF